MVVQAKAGPAGASNTHRLLTHKVRQVTMSASTILPVSNFHAKTKDLARRGVQVCS